MISTLKDKSGAISILVVIILFIGMIAVIGVSSLIAQSYIFDEIRSIMDVSATSALMGGIDESDLRVEKFTINESFVRKEFKNLISSAISGNSTISHFSVSDSDIEINVFQGSWGLGLGSKDRPQARMEVVARVRIDVNSMFDSLAGISNRYYDSFNDEYFTVSYVGKTDNGEIEMLVRSVTRIVYR